MKKKVVYIPVIVIILLVLAVGGVFAFLFLATDTFKSDKQLFLEHISENSKIVDFFKSEELDAYVKKQETMPYTKQGTIKANVTMPTSNENTAKLLAALQNCNISFTGKVDNTNKYSYEEIKANYSDYQSLTFKLLNDSDTYAFKIDDVVNTFIGFENNNLKQFASKMGISGTNLDNIPDKIDLSNMGKTIENEISIDKEIEVEKYQKVILDKLTDDMFSSKEQNDEKIITMHLTSAKCKEIVYELIKTAENDEAFWNSLKKTMIEVAKLDEAKANELIGQAKTSFKQAIETYKPEESLDAIDINVCIKNKKLTATEFISGENTISIGMLENGFDISLKNKNGKAYTIKLTKTTSGDNLKYTIGLNENTSNLFEILVGFEGLTTNTVKETSKLTFSYDISSMMTGTTTISVNDYTSDQLTTNVTSGKSNFEYIYTNTKTFVSQISKEPIPANEIKLVNTAPNMESISSLFEKIGVKLQEVNNQKLQAVGLKENENPFIVYIPAIIPIGVTYFTSTNNMAAIPVVGGAGAAVAMLGISTVNKARTIVYDDQIIDNTSTIIDYQNDGNSSVVSNDISSQAIQAFNTEWNLYAGSNQTASQVDALFSAVIASNAYESTGTGRYITIKGAGSLEGKINIGQTSEGLKTERPILSGTSRYKVEISGYSDKGVVNVIIVTPVE